MASNDDSAPAAGAGVEMRVVDGDDFEAIRESMVAEDELRETVIKKSREVLKSSKHAIYESHRGNAASSATALAAAKTLLVEQLLPIAVANPALRHSLSGAMEEYAEAVVFSTYLAQGRVPTLAELAIVSKEEYLGGVMDAVGEMNRYAVLQATARRLDRVNHVRDTVDRLHHELMLFDFRNGNLRRKFDGIKYALRKLEQIVYEMSLVGGGGGLGFVPSGAGGDGVGEGEVEGGDEGDDGAGAGGEEGEGDRAGPRRGGWRGGGVGTRRGRVGGGAGGSAAKRGRYGADIESGPPPST